MTGIAQDAMKYAGHPYSFGGVPANDKWDCSSFVNKVVGMDLGMAIPGYHAGQFTGSTHGPVVVDWATWTGATTVSSPQQDDLCIWPGFGALGHIGIATDPQHMISALNTHSGTVHTPISGYGPMGVPVIYRRLVDTAGNASTGAGVSVPGCMPLIWVVYYAVCQAKECGRKFSRRERRHRRRENGTRNRRRSR